MERLEEEESTGHSRKERRYQKANKIASMHYPSMREDAKYKPTDHHDTLLME